MGNKLKDGFEKVQSDNLPKVDSFMVFEYLNNNLKYTVPKSAVGSFKGQMSEERVLDSETWPLEAEAAISDIRKHVKRAAVSSALANSGGRAYINLTTLEDRHYCVEMSVAGFRVVGRKYDDVSLSSIENMNYETPYALLDSISEAYRQSFGGELMNKLLVLAKREENAKN